MNLLNDLHHLTFVTADMDRLIAFYANLFEARVIMDVEEEGLRHAFIEIGPHTILHPFQVPGVEPPGPSRSSNVGALTISRSMPRARKRSVSSVGALSTRVRAMGK